MEGKEVERKADDKEPFSALVFKIMADKHVGQLSFARIYSARSKRARTCSTRPEAPRSASGAS